MPIIKKMLIGRIQIRLKFFRMGRIIKQKGAGFKPALTGTLRLCVADFAVDHIAIDRHHLAAEQTGHPLLRVAAVPAHTTAG